MEKAEGRVVELGAGGGQNFPAIEPKPTMVRYAGQRTGDAQAQVPIHVTRAPAEHLSFVRSIMLTLTRCDVCEVDRKRTFLAPTLYLRANSSACSDKVLSFIKPFINENNKAKCYNCSIRSTNMKRIAACNCNRK